jgi:arylamine N-acetyltransferase
MKTNGRCFDTFQGGTGIPNIFSRELADFTDMCHFHQTSQESHFTRNRICSRATPDGRITLSDSRLIITTGEKRQERDG